VAQQVTMSKAVRDHLERNIIGQKIGDLTIQRVLGIGETAVTYEVEDRYGAAWALKLVMRKSYGNRAPFSEIARFSQARDDRFLVFPKEVLEWTLKLGRTRKPFICFKSRKVTGETLEDFLQSKTDFSLHIEILRFMENISAGLDELQRLGFSHGDLHARNIMREVIGQDGPLPEIRYVVIDFSEAYPVDQAHDGLAKDLENFGNHLRGFSDNAYSRQSLSRDDEKMLKAIAHLPGLLDGSAPESIGITKASDVLRRFKDALRAAEEAPRKLPAPFGSLSAENIANDELLTNLCFTNSRIARELIGTGNTLLVGPRGCGKTMLFRRMRLRTKILAGKTDEVKRDPYAGFYLPCESLFYMRFSDLSDTDVAENLHALILFFNMAALSEVAGTLPLLPKSLGPIPRALVTDLVECMREETSEMWGDLLFPAVMETLAEVADCAEKTMRHIRRLIAYRQPVKCRGSTDFIARLVDLVKRELPCISSRYFIFFLDDYTEDRLPIALQEALHPVLCQRAPGLCFKISAHMFGSIYSYTHPLAFDEGRNIMAINLGSAYLNRDKKRREGKLLLEILNSRLKESEGYQGTVEDWLGHTTFPGGRSISRMLQEEKGGKSPYYHGVECLEQLCTGDYSEMIRLVGEIFEEAGVKAGASVSRIPPEVQDRAIKRISREFLNRIRYIRPDGEKLFDVVNAFGQFSRQVLLKHKLVEQGKDSRGRRRKDPYDVLSIYVDNLPKASRGARLIWERLQRASILVDIGLAPSQRVPVADRATLRRIYCPAFKTTLTSSEHLQLEKDEFEWFMNKPTEFVKHQLKRTRHREATLWEAKSAGPVDEGEVSAAPEIYPEKRDYCDYVSRAPAGWANCVRGLPEAVPLKGFVKEAAEYDLFIGAFGFEERTSAALSALVSKKVLVRNAILMEYDRNYQAAERRRPEYHRLVRNVTGGEPYRPFNAPVGSPDPAFPERLQTVLETLSGSGRPRILFDCTSCPSLVLSQTLAVLLSFDSDLTILYSEAAEYFPTRQEWESGKIKPRTSRVKGPFAGVRFVAKPPCLQADDSGERPVMLVLFPTFNTERTDGVLAEVDPAMRIWLFGEPHDLSKNQYRIEMAKTFAAPIMYPRDPWALITTFDFREALAAMGAIYYQHHSAYRIVVMPHGSKMQTLAVNLFNMVHQVSMVFAMPKTYDPEHYSRGCLESWVVPLGETGSLAKSLKASRVVAGI